MAQDVMYSAGCDAKYRAQNVIRLEHDAQHKGRCTASQANLAETRQQLKGVLASLVLHIYQTAP